MSTTTPSWTENQTLESGVSIAAGGNAVSNLDMAANGYDIATIQFDIAHGSSSGVTVEFFSSPDSGTTKDDVSLPGGFTTSGTDVKKTIVIMGHPYVTIKITNNDGSNSTGTIKVKYAARKWNTA